LYVDGVLDVGVKNTFGVVYGGTILQIGASKFPVRRPRLHRPAIEGYTRDAYFHGFIDEVVRYRRELSAAELSMLYSERRKLRR
jgi:hypothetical protein